MKSLTEAEELKFRLLGGGLRVTNPVRERIMEATGGHPATPADYASTSGLILLLHKDVWVNAPIVDNNPLMVGPDSCVIDIDTDVGGFVITGGGLSTSAALWVPPQYHHELNTSGEPFTKYAYTHADRVRIAPIAGCSMRCRFCDLPYEFAYQKKPTDRFVEAVSRALSDQVQPASHVLISGGTPNARDIDYVRKVYEEVLTAFPSTPIDIMMAPLEDLIDPAWLANSGVAEVSANIEIVNEDVARKIMPQKHRRIGISAYMSYLERAAATLGPNRVRSMLMVGLEPVEDTLRGVRLIAERGCIPVLSPFRPDSKTPLAYNTPPSSLQLRETFLRARDITEVFGVPLGPRCIPCSHNTLTLRGPDKEAENFQYGQPNMLLL